MKGLISRLPSEYFGDNVFIGASTMSREEVRRRHVNGIDALMWGTDYPHPEGSWPNTRARLKNDFQDATIEDTRRLLGLNAVDCYGWTRSACRPSPIGSAQPQQTWDNRRICDCSRRHPHCPLVAGRVRLRDAVRLRREF
ncbi:MAG: hypothetical protein Ct9H300mP12_04540 [Acidimicrobiales bacterium]|nr:MAG: hypothetical protein Ct9H300mP12_04540 [Acidimicrobiales bacterium]